MIQKNVSEDDVSKIPYDLEFPCGCFRGPQVQFCETHNTRPTFIHRIAVVERAPIPTNKCERCWGHAQCYFQERLCLKHLAEYNQEIKASREKGSGGWLGDP